MRTVEAILKDMKLNKGEMNAEQMEVLEAELIAAENVECGIEEVKEAVEINEKEYYLVSVTRIDTWTEAKFILNKVIASAKTKKTLMKKFFNGKDDVNSIDSTDDGTTSTLTYEKIMTGKRLMILGMV